MTLATHWNRTALPVILFCMSLLFAGLSHASGSLPAEAPNTDTHAAEAADPEDGHGSGDHGGLNFADFSNKETPPIVALLFNFVALVLILYFVLRKPLGSRFKDRKDAFTRALEEAETAKKAAEDAMEAARAKMDAVDKEMAEIRSAVRAASEREVERILAEAESGAARSTEDARTLATQEIARMAESVRKEIVDGIVAEAADIIREKITETDRNTLSDRYVQQIGTDANRAAQGK